GAGTTIGDLSGTGAGSVVLGTKALTAGTAGSSSFAGVVSGTGSLVKQGAGVLTFTGVSTYQGGTTVNGGTLALTGTGVLTATGALAVNVGGTFDISGITAANATIGDLSGTGAGSVVLGNKALTAGTVISSSFAGVISGTNGSLVKQGAGALTLTGSDTYSGATTVAAGKLLVNGSIASSSLVTVQTGATLGGSGTTGAVHVDSGGTLAAGNSPGLLHTGDLALVAGATFEEQLAGTTAGTGYDQIAVTGTVDLGGATLNTLLLGGFAPALGASFTLIDNDAADAVTGTFAGLAEGATLILAGTTFTISYHGGDGNDVVLGVSAVPPSPPAPSPPPPPPSAPPLLGNTGEVYRLYETALHRAPERAGLDYYVGLLAQGVPAPLVAGGFLGGSEYLGLYGSTGDAAFVTQLYANAFGRVPDTGGLAYQLAMLADHPGLEGRELVLLGVSQSPEAQVKLVGTLLLDGTPIAG
ncbi:MAG: autotransporter-associated beta strand repeat-containing protein, partial [Pseudomonadota bacterium]